MDGWIWRNTQCHAQRSYVSQQNFPATIAASIIEMDLKWTTIDISHWFACEFLVGRNLFFEKCDMIKGNESLVENFNFNFLTPLSYNPKMLHFDANPITIECQVTDLWWIWQCQKQYKTKEFEHCFCQYLKYNITDIRLIPLDHVTNVFHWPNMKKIRGTYPNLVHVFICQQFCAKNT